MHSFLLPARCLRRSSSTPVRRGVPTHPTDESRRTRMKTNRLGRYICLALLPLSGTASAICVNTGIGYGDPAAGGGYESGQYCWNDDPGFPGGGGDGGG